MRSRCLMCANALAAFARENPSRERGRGKSGDNYVLQSQTLFRSYCKRARPPLREGRKTLRVIRTVYTDKLFSSLPYCSKCLLGRFCAKFRGALERRRRQGRGAERPALVHGGLVPRTAWHPRWLGLVAGSPRGRGPPPPWAALSTPPFPGCPGLLGSPPPPHRAASAHSQTPLRGCSRWNRDL